MTSMTKAFKFVMNFVRYAKRGGKCENCGSTDTWMSDSGNGWGCTDCGHFTEKKQ